MASSGDGGWENWVLYWGTDRYRRSSATELLAGARNPRKRPGVVQPSSHILNKHNLGLQKLILFSDLRHAPQLGDSAALSINECPAKARKMWPTVARYSPSLAWPLCLSLVHLFYNFPFFFCTCTRAWPGLPANSIRVVLSAPQGCRNAHAASGTARVANEVNC